MNRPEAVGFPVHGAVDLGLFWSIYFYDPNNIPPEATREFMKVVAPPAVVDDAPLDVVAEGSGLQAGHWPRVTKSTPAAEMTAHGSNALPLRDALLAEGRVRFKDDPEPGFVEMVTNP